MNLKRHQYPKVELLLSGNMHRIINDPVEFIKAQIEICKAKSKDYSIRHEGKLYPIESNGSLKNFPENLYIEEQTLHNELADLQGLPKSDISGSSSVVVETRTVEVSEPEASNGVPELKGEPVELGGELSEEIPEEVKSEEKVEEKVEEPKKEEVKKPATKKRSTKKKSTKK